LRANVRQALYNYFVEFEGPIPHMYLDSRTLVTVGLGFKIDPYLDALRLGLHNWTRDDGGPVTEPAFHEEWDLVKEPYRPRPTGWRKVFRLSPGAMRALFDSKINENQRMLKSVYGAEAWHGFPADAQMGMLVHTWLVPAAEVLRTTWHDFCEACRRQDWRTAGPESLWRELREGHQPRQHQRRWANLRMFDNAAVVKEVNDMGRTFRMDPGQLFYPRAALDSVPPDIAERIEVNRRERTRWGTAGAGG
jgi:hypothetical protein